MYLGKKWALTARHVFDELGPWNEFHVAIPLNDVEDLNQAARIGIRNAAVAPNNADLMFLWLTDQPAKVEGIPIAAAGTVGSTAAFSLCGFGSDDCEESGDDGINRTTSPKTALTPDQVRRYGLDPAVILLIDNVGVPALICDGDSGGGVLAGPAGNRSLVAILDSTLDQVEIDFILGSGPRSFLRDRRKRRELSIEERVRTLAVEATLVLPFSNWIQECKKTP
jgi:hypothetical protein